MFSSYEIRWFSEGLIPDTVREFMGSSFEKEPERSDWYLISKDPGLGIKLRQGNVEFKKLVKSLGEYKNGAISGMKEIWRKWSFKIIPEDYNLTDIEKLNDSQWLNVSKKRMIAKYEIEGGNKVKKVQLTDRPAEGCNMEVTELEVRNQYWWTLCLEAFGDEKNIGNNFLLVLNFVFDKPNNFMLNRENSYSYAQWAANFS